MHQHQIPIGGPLVMSMCLAKSLLALLISGCNFNYCCYLAVTLKGMMPGWMVRMPWCGVLSTAQDRLRSELQAFCCFCYQPFIGTRHQASFKMSHNQNLFKTQSDSWGALFYLAIAQIPMKMKKSFIYMYMKLFIYEDLRMVAVGTFTLCCSKYCDNATRWMSLYKSRLHYFALVGCIATQYCIVA